MQFTFTSKIFTQGARVFAEIPFNVWVSTKRKGNIPCRVTLCGESFECRLIPKGGGNYVIPIPKAVFGAQSGGEYEITLEPIAALTRIVKDSPYSAENPVRKIDGIASIPLERGFCGHCCVAMLAAVPLCEVKALMSAPASWSKISEALTYYGIAHDEKPVLTHGRETRLPECCILYGDGFTLWFKGTLYGGESVDFGRIKSFLRVNI